MSELTPAAITPFGIPAASVATELDGIQYIFQFPNGYGASVICNPYSYGNSQGLWEMAGLVDGELYAEDVNGWLTDGDVTELLLKLQALPKPQETLPEGLAPLRELG